MNISYLLVGCLILETYIYCAYKQFQNNYHFGKVDEQQQLAAYAATAAAAAAPALATKYNLNTYVLT